MKTQNKKVRNLSFFRGASFEAPLQSQNKQLYFQGNKVSAFWGPKKDQFNYLNLEILSNSFTKLLGKKTQKLLICSNGNTKSEILKFYFVDPLKTTKHKIFELDKTQSLPIEVALALQKKLDVDFLIYFNIFNKRRESSIYFFSKNSDYFAQKTIDKFNAFIKDRKTINHLIVQKFETQKVKNSLIDEVVQKLYTPKVKDKNVSIGVFGSSWGVKKTIETVLRNFEIKTKTKNTKFKLWSAFLRKLIPRKVLPDTSEIVLMTNSGGNQIRFFYKHNNKYIHLDHEASVALYLFYLNKKLGNLKEYFAIFDFTKERFLANLAQKYGLQVLENNQELPKNKKFLFERVDAESISFNLETPHKSQNLLLTLKVCEIISEFRKEKIRIKPLINKIYRRIGAIKKKNVVFFVPQEIGTKLLERFRENQKINEQLVESISESWDEFKNKKTIKCYLEDGAVVWSTYNFATKEFKSTYSERVQGVEDNINFLNNSKHYSEYLLQQKDVLDERGFKVNSPKKYVLFSLIVGGIFYYLFASFFRIGSSSTLIFVHSWDLLRRNKGVSWNLMIAFVLIIYPFLNTIFNSIFIKRVARFQKQKVAFRHLFVGTLVGVFFSNITPLPIGGDFATFWYLRKKGVKQNVLVVALSLGLLVWNILVLVLFFLIVPYLLYNEIEIFSKDPLLMGYLFGGVILNLIWFTILLAVSKFKTVQSFLVNVIVEIIKWLPISSHNYIDDYIDKFYSSVAEIREGINFFYKKTRYIFECLVWKFCSSFLPIVALITIYLMPQEGLSFWSLYLKMILHRLLNTVAVSPGGIGISEILYQRLLEKEVHGFFSLKSINFLFNTAFGYIIPTLISLFVLIQTIVVDKIRNWKKKKSIRKFYRAAV